MKISSYFLIEFTIRDRILSGKLLPGAKLPSERDLCDQFGVSVITVRTALSKLENEGLILRKAGKGTFVNDGININKPMMIKMETTNVRYISEKPSGYGVKVMGIEETEIGRTRIAENLTGFLGKSNRDHIGVVRRVRLMNDIPVQYIENYIPVDMMKHLTIEELSQRPLQSTLREKTGLEVGATEMYIESIPAEADIADLLQCTVFIPLILFRSYFWFANEEPYSITNLFGNPLYVKYCIMSKLTEFNS
jgi:GntR family transcriptional regulator